MRVLLANKFFCSKGGAERVVFAMDQALNEAGHRTAHFAMRHPENEPSAFSQFFPSRVDLRGVQAPGQALKALGRFFYSAEVDRLATRLIDQFRPDLAVLHNTYHQLGPALLVALRRKGVPTALLLHDFKPVCPSYLKLRGTTVCSACSGGRFWNAARFSCGGSVAHGIVLSLEAYWQWHVLETYRNITAYWAPSRYLADEFGAMGFRPRIELLRNPVTLLAHQPSFDLPCFGFAGRLSQEKGIEVLVELAAQLRAVEFRVAGDGPRRDWLHQQKSALGLDNLTLLGHLDRSALDAERTHWRATLMPSYFVENSPMAILESWSAGIPVIAFRHGGMAELLGFGGGLGVEPFCVPDFVAAVQELAAASSERLRQLGEKGRTFVREEADRATYAARLEPLMRAAVERGGDDR